MKLFRWLTLLRSHTFQRFLSGAGRPYMLPVRNVFPLLSCNGHNCTNYFRLGWYI